MKGTLIMKEKFSWDSETGIAICVIEYSGEKFYGKAVCHDSDMDFLSERTGCSIAESRALIKQMKYIKKCELMPELKALKNTYHVMTVNKNFNHDSVEARIMRRHIKMKEAEILDIKNTITKEKEALSYYINEKDKLYKKLRKNKQSNTTGQN